MRVTMGCKRNDRQGRQKYLKSNTCETVCDEEQMRCMLLDFGGWGATAREEKQLAGDDTPRHKTQGQ